MANKLNKTMKEILESCWKHNLWLKILTFASIVLVFTGMFLPPLGIIDNSVIIAVGELAGFGALWEVAKAIDKGYDTKVKIKEIEMEFGAGDSDKEGE